jgi:hypothetical protein
MANNQKLTNICGKSSNVKVMRGKYANLAGAWWRVAVVFTEESEKSNREKSGDTLGVIGWFHISLGPLEGFIRYLKTYC